jgi:transposase-like protein
MAVFMSKYNEEVVKRITELVSSDSYTVPEICKIVGIHLDTYYNWLNKKTEFSEKIKKARNALVREIEAYEPTPENIKNGAASEYHWQVYGLGLAAKKESLIYPKWRIIDEYPPKELKNYTYRKNHATNLFLSEPIDDFNHLLDLYRYVVQTKISVRVGGGIRRISF